MSAEYTMVSLTQALYNFPVIVVPINASYIYPYVGACRNKVNCYRKSLSKLKNNNTI